MPPVNSSPYKANRVDNTNFETLGLINLQRNSLNFFCDPSFHTYKEQNDSVTPVLVVHSYTIFR